MHLASVVAATLALGCTFGTFVPLSGRQEKHRMTNLEKSQKSAPKKKKNSKHVG